jgi:hypothetical protein
MPKFDPKKQSWLLIAVMLLATALLGVLGEEPVATAQQPGSGPDASGGAGATEKIAEAFANRAGGIQVAGSGVVSKLLPDDLKGSRHQKFILRLTDGRTVLIAHNIDLAPRVDGLNKGDRVEFHGVYEWNPQGGVIHWTHDDPAGQHPDGWLKHDAKTYR